MKATSGSFPRLLLSRPILNLTVMLVLVAGMALPAMAQKPAPAERQGSRLQPNPSNPNTPQPAPRVLVAPPVQPREIADIASKAEKVVTDILNAHKGAVLAFGGDVWNGTPAIQRFIMDRAEALKPGESLRVVIFSNSAFKDVTFRGDNRPTRREMIRSLMWEYSTRSGPRTNMAPGNYMREWMSDSLAAIVRNDPPREGLLLWLGSPSPVSVARVEEALNGRTCPVHVIVQRPGGDNSGEGSLRRLAAATHGSFSLLRDENAPGSPEERSLYIRERLLLRAEGGWIETPAMWLGAVPDVIFPFGYLQISSVPGPDLLLELQMNSDGYAANASLKNPPEELKAYPLELVEQLLDSAFLTQVRPERLEALKAAGGEIVSRIRLIMPPAER